MPQKTRKLENDPIVIVEYEGELKIDDVYSAWEESVRLTENEKGKVFRITDTRNVDLQFSDLVLFLAEAARSDHVGAHDASRFEEVVIAAPGSLTQLGADSLKQAQYGAMNIQWFDDLDEALKSIRQRLVAS